MTSAWSSLNPIALDITVNELLHLYDSFPVDQVPNESHTEQDLIWPVLHLLGWKSYLPQQNLSSHGRMDVPDGLLFLDDSAKQTAIQQDQQFQGYSFGTAILEVKRWLRPLSRSSEKPGEMSVPASQMLRYIRRVDDLTEGRLRWGILTNGHNWRLYYAGAKSPGEDYIDLNVFAILKGNSGNGGAEQLYESERFHWLKVFLLLFGCEQFRARPLEGQTFHLEAIAEAKFYQQRVTQSLSQIVFDEIFPSLIKEIGSLAPTAETSQIRQSTLIFLYRLLFLLYSEDRGLLPVHDRRYDDYSFRKLIRNDVGRRKDEFDVFSNQTGIYWCCFQAICRIIADGDSSIGLPPYNGGLFDLSQTLLLNEITLHDAMMAQVVDALSFEKTSSGRRYINYRNLGVQHLGAIYEQLLDQEVVRRDGRVHIQLNSSARKNQGSYYTPDDLVSLIVSQTITPLIHRAKEAFKEKVNELDVSHQEFTDDIRVELSKVDPALAILDLKMCDPSMGSGHFLVNLVDQLAEHVVNAIAYSEVLVDGYCSPVATQVKEMEHRIRDNAQKNSWVIEDALLDQQRLIRRLVLKRCIYGVDKNPMAVELAKVSLWLHTLTTGAPLSFLDHHLICGDSLFGSETPRVLSHVEKHGFLMREPVLEAISTMEQMRALNRIEDVDVSDISRSQNMFSQIHTASQPLHAFVAMYHAFEWFNLSDSKLRQVFSLWLDGGFGDPVQVALGRPLPQPSSAIDQESIDLIRDVVDLAQREHFLIWEIAFPDVWINWNSNGDDSGFDAIVGNPPWERMELKPIEWFMTRKPEIAYALTSAERHQMMTALEESDDPMAEEFILAKQHIERINAVVPRLDVYKDIGRGKNLYAMFLARSLSLIKPSGRIGLLIPSGIAGDKQFAKFFRSIAHVGKLRALYDFENRRSRSSKENLKSHPSEQASLFFPDVHRRFKFCVFLASAQPSSHPTRFGFFLDDPAQVNHPEKCFELSHSDFQKVNPNTGTAPIFRTRRDAQLTFSIYDRMPVLLHEKRGADHRAWPVHYYTMYNTGSDSGLFRTRNQLLQDEKAFPVGNNRFRSKRGEWSPLYEGKMVQAFDHRASDSIINPENLFRPGQKQDLSDAEKQDPNRLPEPRFWILDNDDAWPEQTPWMIGFKDVTSVTNMRTMIAALIPRSGVGHTLPLLRTTADQPVSPSQLLCMLANLNSIVFDYVARQKVQTTHFSWFVLKQMPVVSLETFSAIHFGEESAEKVISEAALTLTYTSTDMSSLAHGMGYVSESGEVLPPFVWDAQQRLNLRAKLDAAFFHLYGATNTDDIQYIYETFTTFQKKEEAKYGQYSSLQMCLHWFNALESGEPNANIVM